MASSSIPQDILDKFSSLLGDNHYPPPISIPESFLLKKDDLDFYLVFKIFTCKQLQLHALAETLSAAWNCHHPPRISNYHKHDIFLAKFDDKSETDHIVEGAPWLYNGDLVSVQRCKPNTLPLDYDFHVCPFWVQLHGFPFDYLTSDVALLLGNQLGSIVSSPSYKEVEKWSEFIRIRVNIDVSKPLVGKLPISVQSQKTITIQIRYENLPKYCCFCGMIGHIGESDCRVVKCLEATITEDLSDEAKDFLRFKLRQPKYTESLGASHPAKKINKAEITEMEENIGAIVSTSDSQGMQLSAPAKCVMPKKLVLELHGDQIISSFKKMRSCFKPSADVPLNRLESTNSTELKHKIVISVEVHNDARRTKAISIVLCIPGVISVAMNQDDKLEVIGHVDPVALITMLRKRFGLAVLVMVSHDGSVRKKQLFVDINGYNSIIRGRTFRGMEK